jgi:membrane associated rhomboid family serine protease
MGISNRDYYRDDAPSFGEGGGGGYGGPNLFGVKSLVIVCASVFFLQNVFANGANINSGLTEWLSLSWSSLKNFEIWRVVSYGFVHGSIRHLFFNMIGLWVLGRMIEGIYGSREFIAFFLVAVIVSGVLHIGISELGKIGEQTPSYSPGVIGASGGVLAVVILAAMNFPRQRMHLFLLPVSFELRWLAAFYVALDVVMILTNQDSGVAHLAHLAGAGFGALYFTKGWRILSTSSSRSRSQSGGGLLKKLTTPKPKKNPNVRIYEPPAEELDREVDRILDKINREGRESLSSDEEGVLMRASEKYQKSRNV